MPFPHNHIRPFTREDILAIDPGQDGVYGLFKADQWIYIGKGDIRDRLLDHYNGDNYCISAQRPTHWIGWVTSDMDRIERELIRELQPCCNQRVG